MAANSQTTFSNAFSWMKMFEFRLKFHWSLFPRIQLTLCQIMAWRRTGDKPLSEPMMVSLITHICVTRPQWVKGQMSPYSLPRNNISDDQYHILEWKNTPNIFALMCCLCLDSRPVCDTNVSILVTVYICDHGRICVTYYMHSVCVYNFKNCWRNSQI